MKDGFVFKRSWAKALNMYPEETRREILDATIQYAFYGKLPTEKDNSITCSVMAFIIAEIDEQISEDDEIMSDVVQNKERLSRIRREAGMKGHAKRWGYSEPNDGKNGKDGKNIDLPSCQENDGKKIQNETETQNYIANVANLPFCQKHEDLPSSKENGEKEKKEKESCTKEKDKEENPLKENPPIKRESSEREKHPSQPSSELQETKPDKGNKTPSPNPSPFDFRKQLLKECLDDRHTENVKQVIDDWMLVRKRKNAVNSQTAFVRIMSQIKKAKVVYGLSCEQCIQIAAERSWTGFESEWLNESRAYGFTKKQTETKIESVNDLWK